MVQCCDVEWIVSIHVDAARRRIFHVARMRMVACIEDDIGTAHGECRIRKPGCVLPFIGFLQTVLQTNGRRQEGHEVDEGLAQDEGTIDEGQEVDEDHQIDEYEGTSDEGTEVDEGVAQDEGTIDEGHEVDEDLNQEEGAIDEGTIGERCGLAD